MSLSVGSQPYQINTPSIYEVNRQLAENIVSHKNANLYMDEICLSEDFYNDPTAHLINEMIKRSVGRCRSDDLARAFVISKIPGFIEKVSSIDYLKSFAVKYFTDPNSHKIMQVFEKSIESAEFKKYLDAAIDKYNQKNYYEAENILRISLTVFEQSKQLQAYAYPECADAD